MKNAPGTSNPQLIAILVSFSALALSFVGIQMEDGPLRIALVLMIVVLAAAVGAFLGLALRHQDGADEAKARWGQEAWYDDHR